MKKKLFLLIKLLFIILFSNGFAQKPQALFNYSTFYSPENGSYIETYIYVIGNSVEFKENENNKFQAAVDISLVFKKNEIVEDFVNYTLVSQESEDTISLKPDFFDQKRFYIPNGIYNIELSIGSEGNDASTAYASDIIILDYSDGAPMFSTIQLVERYSFTDENTNLTKSGLELIPYLSDTYNSDVDEFYFYTELYNLNQIIPNEEEFIIQFFIEEAGTLETMSEYSRFQRQKSNSANVIYGDFNIQQLPTGSYQLVVHAIDRKNNLICEKKVPFQRFKPGVELSLADITTVDIQNSFVTMLNDVDTLLYLLRSIRPISSHMENKFIDKQQKTKEMVQMQQFFLNFWKQRNWTNPEVEWKSYNKQVIVVNELYSTKIRYGFETDRGRVYLEYGTPNTIDGEVMPMNEDGVPFEVWHYYTYKTQRDIFFVFANPDIIGVEYSLVHSNARGEITNSVWKGKAEKYIR